MNKEKIYTDIVNIISERTAVLRDEPMSKHTSFKIGGIADLYIKVKDIEDIRKILEYSNKNNVKLTVIGNGSNLLVCDNGIRGITLKIELDKLEINEQEKEITVGAGILLSYLAQILLKKEIRLR